MTPDELLRRLARVTLEGIEFLEAARLGDGDRPLGGVIAEAEYAARLPDGVDVAAAFARAAAASRCRCMRTSEKEIGRTVDVRTDVARRRRPGDDGDARRRLDWHGGADW